MYKPIDSFPELKITVARNEYPVNNNFTVYGSRVILTD